MSQSETTDLILRHLTTLTEFVGPATTRTRKRWLSVVGIEQAIMDKPKPHTALDNLSNIPECISGHRPFWNPVLAIESLLFEEPEPGPQAAGQLIILTQAIQDHFLEHIHG